MNGTTLSNGGTSGTYSGELPSFLSPGDPLDTIPVTWTSSTNPESFAIRVEYSGTGERWDVTGDLRSFDIPIGVLPVNQPMVIKVFAYNDGEFTGPYDPGSEMNIRGSIFSFPTVTIIDLTQAQPSTWGGLKNRYE